MGTPAWSKCTSPSDLASHCGTLNRPCSVGIRSSSSGYRRRVSSAVDQIAWRMPAAAAARAWLAAWVVSRSASKCSKNDVMQNAPYAPSKARDQAVDVVEVGAHHGGASVGQRPSGGASRGFG